MLRSGKYGTKGGIAYTLLVGIKGGTSLACDEWYKRWNKSAIILMEQKVEHRYRICSCFFRTISTLGTKINYSSPLKG